jgi:hypothetical protein
MGEWRYSSTFLDLGLDGDWSASCLSLLIPKERSPSAHWIIQYENDFYMLNQEPVAKFSHHVTVFYFESCARMERLQILFFCSAFSHMCVAHGKNLFSAF